MCRKKEKQADEGWSVKKQSGGDRPLCEGKRGIWRAIEGVLHSHCVVLTELRPCSGPYLSSCCKLWSVEGQQY